MNIQDQHAAVPQRKRRNSNSLFYRRQKAIAVASAAVAEQLNEPNGAAIGRLMEIFGANFVGKLANDARARFEAAQALGPEAYQPQPKGSDVATYTGEPRSLGGVFFYLTREYATSLGLDWYGLRIPPAPRDAAPNQTPAPQVHNSAKAVVPKPIISPEESSIKLDSSVSVNAPKQDTAKVQPVGETAAPKPNRIKATVAGTPLGAPKPTDQPGVLQLVFDVEMTPTMPKGLPTLGRGRVIVLCTEKQYRQAQTGDDVPARVIVEGEAATTLSTAGKPLLLVVCTRITTPEIEAARRPKES